MQIATKEYDAVKQRALAALSKLGAPADLFAQRKLGFFADADELVVAHVSANGREHFLAPDAAQKWSELRAAAEQSGVTVLMISGFRSFDRQFELVSEKLNSGLAIEEILKVLAPPGCSEHHTGRAIDIGTPGCDPLSDAFDVTNAFRWLEANAASFGFRMTYPRGNPWGFQYEPWHWCYTLS